MQILPPSLAEMMLPALLSICAWSLLLTQAEAQTAHPSNNTADLFLPRHDSNYELHSRQFPLPPIKLAPLTRPLRRMLRDGFEESGFNISGTLAVIGADNATKINENIIALISCDKSAYSVKSNVEDTLRSAITGPSNPSAIILYSTESSHCNYTSEDFNWPQYTNVFTATNRLAAREMIIGLHSGNNSQGECYIVPDMAVSSFQAGSGNGGGQRNNVAMIILYSITGIITALFLAVIVTGAIRAHLNPDRYGPRNAVGRPRQSRAKGIARAMLETLPIVKFGDPEDGKSPTTKPDIELASNDGDAEHDRSISDAMPDRTKTSQAEQLDEQPPQLAKQQRQETAPSTAEASASHLDADEDQQQDEGVIGPASPEQKPVNPDQSIEGGALVCPICTDDFIKGQDVRLLPCQHKFHPECVDPWLINVSGTCPLCRVNLNPEEPDPDPEDPTSTINPATTASTNATIMPATSTMPTSATRTTTITTQRAHHQSRLSSSRRHHGLSSYFAPASSRMGSETGIENDNLQNRLETLRRMRSEHQANSMTATGAIEPPSSSPSSGSGAATAAAAAGSRRTVGQADDLSRRNRLSTRLRDRFRIRTRRHGADADADADVDADAGAGAGAGTGTGTGTTTATIPSASTSATPTVNAGGDAETPADTTTTSTQTTPPTQQQQQTTTNTAPT
ncbi:hypothetical protein ACJ72_00935 [Emergomyces africanus]|uniref:RING-type domain-containing protein n=1 Tax=Emergomyces africanus TaxID=1955775 RepID=A0A1B7P6R8_9EURO|nr:hypothetical protein ACJ72_00935 [Emergomyces africanus]